MELSLLICFKILSVVINAAVPLLPFTVEASYEHIVLSLFWYQFHRHWWQFPLNRRERCQRWANLKLLNHCVDSKKKKLPWDRSSRCILSILIHLRRFTDDWFGLTPTTFWPPRFIRLQRHPRRSVLLRSIQVRWRKKRHGYPCLNKQGIEAATSIAIIMQI